MFHFRFISLHSSVACVITLHRTAPYRISSPLLSSPHLALSNTDFPTPPSTTHPSCPSLSLCHSFHTIASSSPGKSCVVAVSTWRWHHRWHHRLHYYRATTGLFTHSLTLHASGSRMLSRSFGPTKLKPLMALLSSLLSTVEFIECDDVPMFGPMLLIFILRPLERSDIPRVGWVKHLARLEATRAVRAIICSHSRLFSFIFGHIPVFDSRNPNSRCVPLWCYLVLAVTLVVHREAVNNTVMSLIAPNCNFIDKRNHHPRGPHRR